MATEPHAGTTEADTDTEAPAPPAPSAPGLRERIGVLLSTISPSADEAVQAAEPVSPHVVAGGSDPDLAVSSGGRPAPAIAYTRLVLAAVAGVAGSVLLAGTSPVWRLAPADTWRIIVPGLNHPGDSSFYAGATFVAGILLMSLGWLGLIGHMRRGIGTPRNQLAWLLVVAALWTIPMLASPIQLSTDAYSYAAQGSMASRGIDPSAHGPNALPHYDQFWRAADPIWRDAPAPYGPVSVGLGKFVVTITGFDVAHAVWGFRALSVIGVVMAGVGVYLIAKRRNASPALALALAVANPVVLVHLIGGAHNDALMMGFLVLGVAAFERHRRLVAVVLITMAVAAKLPAVLALAFVAYQWKGKDVDWKQRLVGFPIVGAISGALIAVMCLVAGMGLGWVTALSSTGKVYSTFAPFTKLGFLAGDLLNAAGLDVDPLTSTVPIARDLGLLTAAAIIVVLLIKSPKLGLPRAIGLSLLALILCGPVVWPWYLPAGFALLAAAGIKRFRPTMIVLVVSSSLLVWPTSVNSIEGLSRYQHWLGFGVVLIICAACVAAQYIARVTEDRRRRLGIDEFAGPVAATAELVGTSSAG